MTGTRRLSPPGLLNSSGSQARKVQRGPLRHLELCWTCSPCVRTTGGDGERVCANSNSMAASLALGRACKTSWPTFGHAVRRSSMKGACRMASLPSPHPHRPGGSPEPMTKLRLFPVEPASTQPTQVGEWARLEIPATDFDLVALHATLEAKKCQLGLTWTDVVREVSASFQDRKPRLIRASNLRDLDDTRFGVDAEIVLLVLYWLGRSPESFVPGHPAADRPEAQLPSHGADALPSFDLPWIHAKLDAGRSCLGLSWLQVAQELGGPFTANGLQRLPRSRSIRFPAVMRLARWLRCPCGLAHGEAWATGLRRQTVEHGPAPWV